MSGSKDLISKVNQKLTVFNDPPVICFDFFDTLISRTVEPEFTKHLASAQLSKLLGGEFTGENLYEIRRNLEAKICEYNVEKGKDLDFNLYDFSAKLYDILKAIGVRELKKFNQKEFSTLVTRIEIAVEKSVQKPCLDTLDLLGFIRSKNLKTILISDFYLPERDFIDLLKHHGLLAAFDDIYISADRFATKGSGKLYDIVLNDLKCSPDGIIMIGDNPHADIKMAAEKGIQTLFIDRSKIKETYQTWLKENCIKKRKQGLERKMRRSIDHIAGPVFPEMGTSLWLFIHRLFSQLIHDKVESVFFFSKEGEFFKKLFDQYQIDCFGQKIISSHYLLVSRKSTYIGSLRPLPQEDFSRLFSQYRDLSFREFMLSLNFEEGLAQSICEDLNLDFHTRQMDLSNSKNFFKLLKSKIFIENFEALRSSQKHKFLRYLYSFNINFSEKGLNIVDVGWKGSIQDNIFNTIGGSVKIKGYYLGLLTPTQLSEVNHKKGILFSDTPEKTPYMDVFNNNRSLFEMILGATHGSASMYVSSNNEEKVQSMKHVKIIHTISDQDGDVHIVTQDLPEERQLFACHIEPIQNAFLKQNSELNRLYLSTGADIPDISWFARRHARSVFHPKKREVRFFENLYHLENFGIFEFTNFLRHERPTLRQRLGHLKAVIKNPGPILETGVWPPIILKRLGLDILQPIDGLRRSFRAFKWW